jgi:tetratricopeptide (TPR) repeat protein
MKKQLIILFLLLGILVSYANSTNNFLLTKANQEYDKGLFNEAIQTYLQIIENNVESSQVYYNLGNAYFKTKNLTSAILYYERAKKLNPNDEDILYNLRVANSRIVDKIESVPQMFFKRWRNQFYNAFSVNNWTKVAIVLFVLTLLFSAIYLLAQSRHIKKLFFIFGIIFMLLSISSYFVSYQKYYYSINHKEAILFEPTITVKSSPNQNSVDLFVIHEGTKLYVLDQVGDWIEIRIANGSIGWLQKKLVKYI